MRSAAFKRGVRALAAALAALALWRAPHADAQALRCALDSLLGVSSSPCARAAAIAGAHRTPPPYMHCSCGRFLSHARSRVRP